ncbi:MAG: nucleotidyltransferase family protein [Prolixibacteraceae bacterium]|jgi:NDP-sugar pyrophosphorylase family protein|nr:nucleotidyltransferase family protein [Prolixibacteraceae bacterium]MBT6767198.1 nucleotidyltransferase family protein [Prolixibacteraceae bacterium]MBT6997811.1 nucleotidyltransferase family protein [Prolixibacteraceae bacterium]MBT7396249.1 nucleotidyltransferase family protein [Prolixibacteraceae bacterium]
MKAMVFAAGLGTRLLDETSDNPKALVKIGGKPMLQHAIERLKNEGIDEIVVNVHHFSELVAQFLSENNFGIPIHISDESDKLLDTGGGLKKAAYYFNNNSPVLIYNVDILSSLDLQTLKNEHLKSGALATLVVRHRETQRYFKFDENKNLVGWLNKKTGKSKKVKAENFENATEMAFSGIHIIQPEMFKLMPETERFSITDFYLDLAKTQLIKGFFDDSELWMDVGKPEQLKMARELFGC